MSIIFIRYRTWRWIFSFRTNTYITRLTSSKNRKNRYFLKKKDFVYFLESLGDSFLSAESGRELGDVLDFRWSSPFFSLLVRRERLRSRGDSLRRRWRSYEKFKLKNLKININTTWTWSTMSTFLMTWIIRWTTSIE